MPPSNSPSDTPEERNHTHEYLHRIAHLEGPVASVASASTQRAEEEANQDNVSFLRTTGSYLLDNDQEPSRQVRRDGAQPDNLANEQQQALQDMESLRRMRRAVLYTGRYTPSQLQELQNELERPSESREISRRLSAYQGWAPGSSEIDLDEPHMTLGDLRALARGHTRSSHDTATRRHIREQEFGQTRGLSGRRVVALDLERDSQPENFLEGEHNGELTTTEASLRTTALLQSVRRHARFSPRSWTHAGEPTMELDRSSRPAEERERSSTSRTTRSPAFPRRDPLDDLRRGISHDLHRTRYREHESALQRSTAEPSRCLEEAIKYLERLRFCKSHSERISYAQAGGFIHGSSFIYNEDGNDFIMDTANIARPQQSSWLRAGSVFAGSQQSTLSMNFPPFQFTNTSRRTQNRQESASEALSPFSNTPVSTRGNWTNNAIANAATYTSSEGVNDSWPVKVTINSIDYESMTLIGKMEAFNVPNKTSPYHHSTIATHLEGEIIDLNHYTLETKSFNASSSVDSTYWRELEPFKSLTDSEIVHNLVSMKWLTEELAQKWILMRWKEKCFITPADAQAHLTISGFYYVSLRRMDGRLEGLYYDPTSTPYQHLSLGPDKIGFPTYQFR